MNYDTLEWGELREEKLKKSATKPFVKVFNKQIKTSYEHRKSYPNKHRNLWPIKWFSLRYVWQQYWPTVGINRNKNSSSRHGAAQTDWRVSWLTGFRASLVKPGCCWSAPEKWPNEMMSTTSESGKIIVNPVHITFCERAKLHAALLSFDDSRRAGR